MEPYVQTQKIRQTWILVLLGISLVTMITLAVFFYDDKTAFLLILSGGFFVGLITLWIFSMKLNISISNEFIEYNAPLLLSKGRIMWADLKSIEFRRSNPINDFGGWGLRYNSKGYKGYIFEGESCLYIEEKNGKKRAFSIKIDDSILNLFESIAEKNSIKIENTGKRK